MSTIILPNLLPDFFLNSVLNCRAFNFGVKLQIKRVNIRYLFTSDVKILVFAILIKLA